MYMYHVLSRVTDTCSCIAYIVYLKKPKTVKVIYRETWLYGKYIDYTNIVRDLSYGLYTVYDAFPVVNNISKGYLTPCSTLHTFLRFCRIVNLSTDKSIKLFIL